MPFIKIQKTKAYFGRYQVKYRRRREGKTDYARRRKMVIMDKNKYNAPRHRLVVRVTNKNIIAQVVRSHIKGDEVVTAAYAHELPKFGVKVGLTNYASAYCVGLLLGRRLLKKFNLDSKYEGSTSVNGEDYYVEPVEGAPRPFLCVLDVGLRRTTTGARVFAVMKGAADAGVEVPHSETRLVGFDAESGALKADVLRKHLFGGHVADYMRSLKEEADSSPEGTEKYKLQFGRYIAAGIVPDGIEKMYAAAHKAIRADPTHAKKAKPANLFPMVRQKPATLAQRKERVQKKKAAWSKKTTSTA